MLGYRVPAPDEAMLISGSKRTGGAPFEVVVGHGKLAGPLKRVRFLTLAMQEAEVQEPCVTNQGIGLTVRAVIAFKVGADDESITNAGQRFLSDEDRMPTMVGQLFAGHLRSIVGSMTVEEIVTERQKLATEVLDGSKQEMGRMGLVVDSFQIQQIDDRTGYIDQMAAPHRAAIGQAAKIAQAQAEQAAVQAQQEAGRNQMAYQRETAIAKQANDAAVEQATQGTEAKKIQYAQATGQVQAEANRQVQVAQATAKAEIDKATGTAAQAGPLAQAQAQLAVTAAQAELAERQAQLRERQLEIEVVKPAEADAKRTRIAAEADAAAQSIKAQAAASSNRIALDQQLIAMAPELVRAAASSLAGAHVTVLNGADGVGEIMTGAVAQGLSILNTLRTAMAHPEGAANGQAKEMAQAR